MSKLINCPKCSSEKISRNFMYGSKIGCIIVLALGLTVVVQDPTNWFGWLMVVAGVAAFPQKRFKCSACAFKWT